MAFETTAQPVFQLAVVLLLGAAGQQGQANLQAAGGEAPRPVDAAPQLPAQFPGVLAFCPADDCNHCKASAPAQGVTGSILPSIECKNRLAADHVSSVETFSYSRARVANFSKLASGETAMSLSSYDDFGGHLSVCFTTGGGLCSNGQGESFAGSSVLSTIFGGTGPRPQGESVSDKLSALERKINQDIATEGTYSTASQANYMRNLADGMTGVGLGKQSIADANQTFLSKTGSFATQAPPTSTGIAQDVTAELRLNELRSAIGSGPSSPSHTGAPDLFGANPRTEAAPGSIEESIAYERTRLQKGVDAGIISQAQATHAASALNAAERFAVSGTSFGSEAAAALLQEAQSIRLHSAGLAKSESIAVVDKNGVVRLIRITDATPVNGSDLTVQVANFERNYDAVEQLPDHPPPSPTHIKSDDLVGLSKRIASDAKVLFYGGDISSGQALASLALDTTNVLTQVLPFITSGRSAIELLTGQDLYTGDSLDAADRSLRAVNIAVDLWGGKIIVGAAGALVNISKNALETKGAFVVAEELSRALEIHGINPGSISAKSLNHVIDNHTIGGKAVSKIPGNVVKTVFNDSYDWVKGIATTVERGTYTRGEKSATSIIYTHTFDANIGGLPWEAANAGSIRAQQVYFDIEEGTSKLTFRSTYPVSPEYKQEWEFVLPKK